uniref:WGS project CBMG000000000 data, contig CS5907-c001660 n=1 Tax=Fusarium acuminatum CS5907 TaxID=1318461 RepID=A0A090MDB0_9HYPO|nr:unnamed protein product [Fusarium acuminatum CS5907]
MSATPFQTEAWTEYGLGALVLFLRYFARWKTVGFKGYQGDDYFALAAMVFWTSELVMLELIGQSGTNIGVTDEMGAEMSAAEIAKRLVFGRESLSSGRRSVQCSHISLSLPPSGGTALPYTETGRFILTQVLSVKRKLMIGVLLCSGVFIMIATLLRCIFSLRDIEGINTSTIWAIRETFVAIIAVNAAAIKPLFSASRWLVSSKGSSRDKGGSSYIHKHSHPLATIGGSGVSGGRSGNRHHQKYMSHLDDNSSEEHIVGKPEFVGYSTPEVRAGSTASGQSDGQDGIMVTRTYEVTPGKSTLDV